MGETEIEPFNSLMSGWTCVSREIKRVRERKRKAEFVRSHCIDKFDNYFCSIVGCSYTSRLSSFEFGFFVAVKIIRFNSERKLRGSKRVRNFSKFSRSFFLK